MTQRYIKASTDERAKRVINRTKQQDTPTGNNLSTGELMEIVLKDITSEDWNRLILADIKKMLTDYLPYRGNKDISYLVLANLKLKQFLSAQKEEFSSGKYISGDAKQAKEEFQGVISDLIKLVMA